MKTITHLLLGAILILPVANVQAQTASSTASSTPQIQTLPVERQLTIDPTQVKAKSVLVQNLTTGEILYERDADTPKPLASLSKLMTAITVKKIQKNWKILPEKVKLISNAVALTEVDRAVKQGGYMKIDDLVTYMLLSSSNFAAYSLAHELIPFTSFMAYMNFTAKEIGLEHSHFVNGTGLTESPKGMKIDERNSIGSAKDMAKILDHILKTYPELAAATRISDAYIETTSGKKIQIANTNKLLDSLDTIYLGKTGYTNDAGGNLAIVIQKNNQYYAIVVLDSTVADRFTDVSYLASAI